MVHAVLAEYHTATHSPVQSAFHRAQGQQPVGCGQRPDWPEWSGAQLHESLRWPNWQTNASFVSFNATQTIFLSLPIRSVFTGWNSPTPGLGRNLSYPLGAPASQNGARVVPTRNRARAEDRSTIPTFIHQRFCCGLRQAALRVKFSRFFAPLHLCVFCVIKKAMESERKTLDDRQKMDRAGAPPASAAHVMATAIVRPLARWPSSPPPGGGKRLLLRRRTVAPHFHPRISRPSRPR